MIFTWTALLAVALAGADDVLLANGGRLTGVASEEPSRWLVRTPFGDLTLPKDAVHSVQPGRTLLHEYDERAAALCGCPSAAQVFELALWAQEQGLARYVNGLLATTLAIDPDHPEARCLLGYSMQGSRWVSSFERDVLLAPKKAARPPVQARAKRMRSLEKTPYTLGIPMSQATASSGSRSSGGYSLWQGVVPTRNLLNLPPGGRRGPR